MKKNIFKKFIVLFSIIIILFVYNFVFAEDLTPSTDPIFTETVPDITPPILSTPNFVTINLKVYSGDTVLFDGTETVTACPESLESDAPITINGKCAIEQSGLSNTWTWYDSSFSKDSSNPKTLGVLDELGGSAKDDTNYIYWGWFNNLNYGSTAINKHLLTEGEDFLLTYNSHPLRISSDITSGKVGDTIIFNAEEKTNFNSDWSDLIWTPLKDVNITIGSNSCITIDDGTCSVVLDKSGSLNVVGTKSLYVPSNILEIEVSDNIINFGGGSSIPTPVIFNISNAISYLSSVQDPDGSFANSDLYTDWVAIAIAVNNNSNLKSSILNYLKSNPVQSSFITDYERRVMALMALGINPYSGTDVNYIEKIMDSFDGLQFGNINLVNDDIFALILLSNAGYTDDDSEITKDINYIISKQDSSGSWDSIDLTAAAVQALSSFSSLSEVSSALSKASLYLQNTQNNDGGWGNVSSSSWAAQAMNTLGESWVKNGKTVYDYLGSQQSTDGAAISSSETVENRIWATSYVIPAVLKLSWNDILNDFSKPVVVNNSNSNNNTISSVEKVVDTIQQIDKIIPEVVIPKIILNPSPKVTKENTINKKVNLNKQVVITIPLNTKIEDQKNNNLTANALDSVSFDFSMKGLSQNIINFMVNTFHYIGNSFSYLLSFIYVF